MDVQKSTDQSTAANGVSCTSALMRKRCRYELFALLRTMLLTQQYCQWLLEKMPVEGPLLIVICDGVYDTQPVHAVVMPRNAAPCIPPRKNARMHKGIAFVHRNAVISARRNFGRKLWKNWSGYHRRSLVETKMNCIKRPDEQVMSCAFKRLVNELHTRAALLNRLTVPGCPQTVDVV